VWELAARLSGLVLATYVRTPNGAESSAGTCVGGGVLSALAVGCPVCRWSSRSWSHGRDATVGSLQPVLGGVSVGLLAWVLHTGWSPWILDTTSGSRRFYGKIYVSSA
jgi:hypothetical protein